MIILIVPINPQRLNDFYLIVFIIFIKTILIIIILLIIIISFQISGYLFEGHLTVGQEPPPPAWLVAQNLLTTLNTVQDLNALAESSRSQREDGANVAGGSRVPDIVQQLIDNVPQFNFENLEDAIEASMQVCKFQTHR